MPSFTKKVLGALGVKAAPTAPAAKPKPQHKSVLPPTDREALVKNAMALYRKNAAGMRGRIDEALKQLKDEPLNLRDVDSMTRLLSIRRAFLDLRRLMNHRDRRYLVLAGLREWLEQTPKVAPPGVKKLVVKR